MPHGFRSLFRDWAVVDGARESDEVEARFRYPLRDCELWPGLPLAHVNSDRVEAAYRRTATFLSNAGC